MDDANEDRTEEIVRAHPAAANAHRSDDAGAGTPLSPCAAPSRKARQMSMSAGQCSTAMISLLDAVQRCHADFKNLANRIAERCGIASEP